ncbi:hypothetical protein FisN_3Hh618 [Fistulifera solaris]|uniref:M23ase beta-sheet core domain-containing protein n=1 Tax=Fistulifera solaris TaxID=1519565 RepID=A0A1Z5K2Q0_FISSO|nr:hypothetical protein FisN_3Hh618 [Fistulifera solaris]|eukprot:GAX20533.1 hypothetical protein FisN_3Hh618 [Fistulifera solaris]
MPKPKSKSKKSSQKKFKAPYVYREESQLASGGNEEKPKVSSPCSDNFVADAGPGCHIAHPESSDWILEWEAVNADDFDADGLSDIPDIAIDPESGTLTVCNLNQYSLVAYITVYETRLRDAQGRLLEQGSTTNDEGETNQVTTLIVLCPPETFAHLCVLLPQEETDKPTSQIDLEQLRLESDVQPWNQHPDPSDVYHDLILAFPLRTDSTNPSFLCTQGIHGHLTHFFSGNLHAIDFQCPVGTPLLAVADAVVVQVQDHHECTGIAVTNLFHWNSILLQVKNTPPDKPLFVEYVHIQSASVSVGDQVQAGQVIGASGSVGFSPEPHLHFAAYRSDHPTAPTVQVSFAGKRGPYIPRAHEWYNDDGLAVP